MISHYLACMSNCGIYDPFDTAAVSQNLKVKYKGILFYEILMDCVARKRMQKTTSNYLKWFPRYCDLNFTYYLINIHEFIYDIIVEHWNL